VSQISPPIRIVLGVAIAFLAVYMVALRPKSETPAPPPPAPAGNVANGKPAVTGYGKAVESAKGAVAATEAQQTTEGRNAGEVPATGKTATKAAPAAKAAKPAAPAAPAVDTAGLPAPVAKAIQRHEVLALLFTNHRSADDRAVQRALRSVPRFGGSVFVHSAPLGTIARYGRITRGADVKQSPTVVVVDRKLRATTLVGYVDGVTIEQSVVDALRASGGAFAAPFLRSLNAQTSAVAHDLNRLTVPSGGAQYVRFLHRSADRLGAFVHGVRHIPARGRWTAVRRGAAADAAAMRSGRERLARALGADPSAAKLQRLVPPARTRDTAAAKRFAKRAERHGLVSDEIPTLPRP
jgi:hypothetical protein